MSSSTDTDVAPALSREARSGRFEPVWVVFTITWSIAVLFHMAGNSQLAPEWGKALLGAAAVATLAFPRRRAPAGALALAVLVNVWLEAPLLGNNWLLHGFIALTVVGALGTRPPSVGAAMQRLHAPLRLLLLAFYAFAAFSKVNYDFFATPESCGVLFLEESAASWGLVDLVEGWWEGAYRAFAITVAVVELAIPVLLAVTRTRQGGVVLALGFHFVLASNRDHQFFDFSSVLIVLFLLFLPPETMANVVRSAESLRTALADSWPSGPELVRLGGLAAAALVAAMVTYAERMGAVGGLHDVGFVVWAIYGAATFALVATVVRRTPTPSHQLCAPGWPVWLMLVPALAVANGLTPYLEVKTAASWNMYSNLRIVDGASNHLLITRGFPVTEVHERLVEVVAADGVDLSFYIGSDWLLPEQMLLDEIADDPGAQVTGRVGETTRTYVGGQGDGRPEWQQKFQVFRAVDGYGRAGCQAAFGPAR